MIMLSNVCLLITCFNMGGWVALCGTEDFDRTQGSPVAEKEKTRHGQGMAN